MQKQKIPRVPHWRYVCKVGELHPDWDMRFEVFMRYVKEDGVDLHLDDDRFNAAKTIYDTPPMRKITQRMMVEYCEPKVIADVLYHKFKEQFDWREIQAFKKFFFDTDLLNTYEIADFMNLPEPPPVPGNLRHHYTAHKEGADVEIDADAAIRTMFHESFFRAMELKKYGWAGDDKMLKFQNQALSMYRAMQDYNTDTSMPEEFTFEIEYPEETAVDIEDIEE